MDVKLACGDNNIGEDGNDQITVQTGDKNSPADNTQLKEEERNINLCNEEILNNGLNIETSNEDDNFKERIANCRKIIESLKLEIIDEKIKLQEAKSSGVLFSETASVDRARYYTCNMPSSNKCVNDILTRPDAHNSYSSSVDTKLRCDSSLMEYEKQLQRYQDTLTMAQNEKKNAIRKQMLAKVYKLKLMEVENQCNIELLRVKQSLECLEPLKAIANRWKSTDNDSTWDLNNFELLPSYPELNPISINGFNIFTDDEKSEFITPNENPQLES